MGPEKAQLRREAIAWARRRSIDGVDAAVVAASLEHVLEFINSLPGHGQAGPVRARPRPDTGAPFAPGSILPAPEALRRLIGPAGSHARRIQPGIPWPRDRWKKDFPEHGELLDSLPDLLDREGVRRVAKDAHLDPNHAVAAFVVVMLWGFGNVGYGPFRTRRILDDTPDSAGRLHAVAVALHDEGAEAAYRLFERDAKLKWLGPAFGTKFLYFAQPRGTDPQSLIHDALVSAWLAREAGINLPSLLWDTASYTTYLGLIRHWADEIGCDPEDIEYAIFQTMADERGSQWANGDASGEVPEPDLPAWVRNLPNGRAGVPTLARWEDMTTTVVTYLADFQAIHRKRTAEEWRAAWPHAYGKPLIRPPGGFGESVGEFEVIRALRADGWQASWTDTFGSAPGWMQEWTQPKPPARVRRVVADIQRAVPRAKPWDVLAWRGDHEWLIVEFKGQAEKLTDPELRFLQGAQRIGVATSALVIVRGSIEYPE